MAFLKGDDLFHGPFAFYAVVGYLRSPFNLLEWAQYLPSFISWGIYRIISKKRISLFGQAANVFPRIGPAQKISFLSDANIPPSVALKNYDLQLLRWLTTTRHPLRRANVETCRRARSSSADGVARRVIYSFDLSDQSAGQLLKVRDNEHIWSVQ